MCPQLALLTVLAHLTPLHHPSNKRILTISNCKAANKFRHKKHTHTLQFCTKAFAFEEISFELDLYGNIGLNSSLAGNAFKRKSENKQIKNYNK